MFIGEYSHSVDEKSRLSMPAKFRLELKEGIVATRGLDRCLWVYTKTEWEILARRLSLLPISQHTSRAFARLMLAGAWDAVLDTQGRVVLPEYLRRYAGLEKRVIVTGLYNRIEVWDAQRWQEYKQMTESQTDSLAEALRDLGV